MRMSRKILLSKLLLKRRKMELPDELWKIVKDYQIDHQKHHHKKLKLCHEQLSLNRPFSLKKRTLGLIRAIGHSPTWNNLSTRDIIIFEDGSESPARLKLHAIEITPKKIKNHVNFLFRILFFQHFYRYP